MQLDMQEQLEMSDEPEQTLVQAGYDACPPVLLNLIDLDNNIDDMQVVA